MAPITLPALPYIDDSAGHELRVKMNHRPAQSVTLSLLVALLLSTQGLADQTQMSVDDRAWSCNFCSYPNGWFGTFDIGPGYASDASLKFADYRGITQKGAFISLYGDMHYLDRDGRYFDFYARELGLDSRQVEMRGGLRGRFEFRLAYREIPKYRGYGTQTPFSASTSDQLQLPPGWVKSRTTGGMSGLDVSLSPVTLETKRKIFEAGLSLRMTGNWRYEADFQHTQKNGARAFGAGVFTIQSSHFPAPVDYSINRIDMGLEYTNRRSRLRFGFSRSSFDYRQASVNWENPFTPVGKTSHLRAALEPDSHFNQYSVMGSFRLNSKLRVSGHASFGRITQDADFIPYSSNPDFDYLVPPGTTLKGDLDTTSLGARMTARLTPKLNLLLNMKYDDRDNRTPTDTYTPVITDLVLREETPNRPYSFTRSLYSAQLTYRTHTSISINAGLDRKDHERTLQSVRETRDSTWWGEVGFDAFSAAQIRIRLETSDRDISPYRQVTDPGLTENILMRKFHLADRSRDRVLIELDVAPGDRASASLSYFVARDRYSQSILGLMQGNEQSVNLDLGYTLHTNLSLHAFLSLEDYDSDITSAEYQSAVGWTAITEDRFTTWGFGLSGKLTDKLDLGIEYVSSASHGGIVTDTGAGEAPFPDLRTNLRNASVRLNYSASKRWGLSLLAEHENYDSSDWQIDGLGNDGISAILTLGPVSPNYSITIFRLLANYTF